MAPGCEPTNVRALLDLLYRENLIHAGWLAGAGGGGFLYLLTKEPKCTDQLKKLLTSSPVRADLSKNQQSLIFICCFRCTKKWPHTT